MYNGHSNLLLYILQKYTVVSVKCSYIYKLIPVFMNPGSES